MKKLITCTCVLICSMSFVSAQDMSATQREERCQNNKNRIAELAKQLKAVDADFSASMTKKEMEDTRTQLAFVRSLKNNFTSNEDTLFKLKMIGSKFNFKEIDIIDYEYGLEAPYQKGIAQLAEAIAKKINMANSVNRPALLAKKSEIEKQIANHRTNLIALNCDGSSSTKDDGTDNTDGTSQDMPEAQRIERCQNNKNRIAELQPESEKIRLKLSDYWTEEKMAKTKKQAQFVRRFIDQKDKRSLPQQLNDLMAISVENEFKFGSCIERNIKQKDPRSECAKYLLTHINSKIHIEENITEYKQAWLKEKAAIDKEIAKHRTNLIALNCDNKATNSSAGSLRLKGPKMLRKYSKVISYNNAAFYDEYVYTPTSATLTTQDGPPNRRVINWDFTGMPASLSPGQEFTITVTGSLQIEGGSTRPPLSAGVTIMGFEIIKQQHAYLNVKDKREGIYTLKVPANAKKLSFELWGDYSIGTFAIYEYEK